MDDGITVQRLYSKSGRTELLFNVTRIPSETRLIKSASSPPAGTFRYRTSPDVSIYAGTDLPQSLQHEAVVGASRQHMLCFGAIRRDEGASHGF